jgi:hypothetical protein
VSARAGGWFLALNGWLLAFCLAYVVAALVLPRPTYFPLEHRWAFVRDAPGLAMVYYGQLLWALVAGGMGGAAGAAVGRRVPLSREACILVTGWTAAVLVFTILFNALQVFA